MPTSDEALAIAVQHVQAGRLQAAEQVLRSILAERPDDATAWHQLGVVAYQVGQYEAAGEFIGFAIGLDASDPDFHVNLGNVFLAQSRLDRAVDCYQRALELKPDHSIAHYNLSTAFHALGRLPETVDSYVRALEPRPDYTVAHYNLGNSLRAQGKIDLAVACFQRAIALNPQHAEAHNNLGNALRAQGKLDEAVSCFRRALELKPAFAEAQSNLGNVLQAQGKFSEAIDSYRRALELNSNLAQVYHNLGNALQALEKIDEAIVCFRRALDLASELPETHNNLGIALQAQCNLDDALACYSRALELKPGYAEAHYNRSMLWLNKADFQRGWPEYEWRFHIRPLKAREIAQPLWDGSPLGEQTIFVHVEQGLGDTFQFLRYAALIKQQNPRATVIVECQPALMKFLAGCPGFDYLIAEGDELPAFDVYAPLLSLPRVLATDLETIPGGVPYLFADPSLVEMWSRKMATVRGFRIGVNWHGRSGQGEFRKRDIPQEHIAALTQIPGVELIRLQHGRGEQPASGGDRAAMFDPGSDFDTVRGPFMDTAALMMNVDLVITSDTSVPHLAGGLGVPVWLALPYAADWRWLVGRDDSPWYPTMKVFRQRKPGDWADVFERITAEFQARSRHTAEQS
jgi:tetratricopeptide (TPR) repeat protein